MIQMQYVNMMTKEEKQKIKEKLPSRWVKKLIVTTGFSEPSIRNVMAGRSNNIVIERAALELAKEYQSELKELGLLVKELS